MKTKFKSIIRNACHSFGGMVCAGAFMLIASSAQAQNLFESDWGGGTINEFTPGGTKSTFASGLVAPEGLAFNSAGDLFVGNAVLVRCQLFRRCRLLVARLAQILRLACVTVANMASRRTLMASVAQLLVLGDHKRDGR